MQNLRDISLTDVMKEGFHGYNEFIDGFFKINARRLSSQDTNPLVIVYEFEYVGDER